MSHNDWGVSYSSISFVEKVLGGHKKVKSFERINDIQFSITLSNLQDIEMLLVNEYCLGLATIHRALDEFPGIEFIVTSANWNGYTKDAKEYGIQNDLGVFNIGEFIGALSSASPKDYYQKDADGNPIYAYKVA